MIDAVVEIIVGFVLVLVGFGKWKVSKNRAANETFLKKWGLLFRIAGLFIVAVAVVRFLATRH